MVLGKERGKHLDDYGAFPVYICCHGRTTFQWKVSILYRRVKVDDGRMQVRHQIIRKHSYLGPWGGVSRMGTTVILGQSELAA